MKATFDRTETRKLRVASLCVGEALLADTGVLYVCTGPVVGFFIDPDAKEAHLAGSYGLASSNIEGVKYTGNVTLSF